MRGPNPNHSNVTTNDHLLAGILYVLDVGSSGSHH